MADPILVSTGRSL